MLKSLMVRMNDRTIVTISTCLSPGSVTCRKRCQAPAPSTEAASYSSRGIACIPARYDTPKNGNAPPPVGHDHRGHGAGGRGHEGDGPAHEPRVEQHAVEEAAPREGVEHPAPGERDDHRGGDPRQQEQAAEEVASAPDTVEDERHREPREHLEDEGAGGEDEGVADDLTERVVVPQVLVVPQAHEALRIA